MLCFNSTILLRDVAWEGSVVQKKKILRYIIYKHFLGERKLYNCIYSKLVLVAPNPSGGSVHFVKIS